MSCHKISAKKQLLKDNFHHLSLSTPPKKIYGYACLTFRWHSHGGHLTNISYIDDMWMSSSRQKQFCADRYWGYSDVTELLKSHLY